MSPPAASIDTGPLVQLLDSTKSPFDVSIASARTCYSSAGLVYPEQVSADEKSRALRDRIASSTMKAGHLTTRQHPQFIFAIDRVSRQLIWSFLHSHPYYNSEQVSQRYVKVKADQAYYPSSLEARPAAAAIYQRIIARSTNAYFELMDLLEEPASNVYFQVFRARARQPDKWKRSIQKKTMEVARYVLPTATYAYLYHSINGLTLHRYRRLCEACDVPEEARMLVDRMWEQVQQADPLYAAEMADPIPLEDTAEYRFFSDFFLENDSAQMSREFIREYDEQMNGMYSRLAGYTTDAPAVIAGAVRAVLGIPSNALSDGEAIELLLRPSRNAHLGSTLNESTMSRLSRALFNASYTFQKKISHTADSQDQRHRMVPGSRPILMRHFTGEPDYIVPELIRQSSAAGDYYARTMDEIFGGIVEFLNAGGTEEEATYLLPNAFPIRFYESGDLLNLHHKWKARTCYNAQEEIFKASVEELQQIRQVHPEIVSWILAPCALRKDAGATPYCPEGDRFCGIPVWNQTINQYNRVI
ncbi:MAG: FAD-dependent thymidylate synthase [Leptospiraceae bacterium]|nr:FAD-dependent thymidylate synthase [Leptospiraceae bacterium]